MTVCPVRLSLAPILAASIAMAMDALRRRAVAAVVNLDGGDRGRC